MATFSTSSNKKLKFALVTETYEPEINGVAMTLGKITRHLSSRAYQVQVIRPKQSAQDLAKHMENLSEFLVPGISIPFYQQLKFGLPAQQKLIQHWKQHRPDIVHIATEGPLGWSALQAAKRLNIPTISSFHTNFHQYSGHYGLGIFAKPIQNYLKHFHNQTLGTLAPTKKLAMELSDQGYRNVSVMTRGVDTQQFHPSKRCQTLRKQWGANEQDTVVLYVGRLAKEKNIQLVIDAFHEIYATDPQAKLVFVGDGPMRDALKKQCPQAIFVGNQQGEALAKCYASGDVFLFPSITETFGNVVPEALASGLAVVAFNYAAAAQLITHQHNGLLVDFSDDNAFIQAALELVQRSELQQHCKTQAHKQIQHLSWISVCNALELQLNQLFEHHQKHSTSPLRQSSIKRVCA